MGLDYLASKPQGSTWISHHCPFPTIGLIRTLFCLALDYVDYVDSGTPNTGLHAGVSRTFPTEPSSHLPVALKDFFFFSLPIPSFLINLLQTRNFFSFYLFLYLQGSYFIQWVASFCVQIFPDLASQKPFQLVPIILLTWLYHFL